MDGRGRGSSGEDGSSAGAAEPSCSVEEGMRELSIGGGELYPERPGEPNCGYYVRTGHCNSTERLLCKIIQGEKECSHYLKTGLCKFGINCKFHHPDPSFISMQRTAPAFYPQVQSPAPFQYGGIFNWHASWSALFPGSPYDSMLYTPGMVPVPNYFPCVVS